MDRLMEYETKRKKDINQILMLENELTVKNCILIIEDSFSIQSILQKYLISLGYKEVYVAENGREGIGIFNNLVSSGKIIPILLDDSLPDYATDEIVNELFQICNTTKILVMSAKVDHDDSVMLINRGVYGLIQKPVIFANIKNILRRLKDDMESNQMAIKREELQRVFAMHKTMSDSYMSEFVDDKELLANLIEELRSDGIIQKRNMINEMSCNNCNSVRLIPRFSCPVCNETFCHATLIEHHECGNVSESSTYQNDVCPKCNKHLNILGVDYMKLENYYVCNSCKNKFPDPLEIFECQRCGNRQKIHECKWKNSNLYYINSL